MPTTDRAEIAARVDRVARNRQRDNPAVGIRVPGRGLPRGGIDRGDVVAKRDPDRVEIPGDVDARAGDRERSDLPVRVRTPGGGLARESVDCSDVIAWLTADRAEVAACVDRRGRDSERKDLPIRVGVRVPGGSPAGCGVESCEAAPVPAADQEKIPAANTVPLDTASARTSASASGAQAVALPLLASSAAILFRRAPPIRSKTPPA